MFTTLSKPSIPNSDGQRSHWRAVGAFVGDVIGAISIFATGYMLLLIGYGFGLN